MPILAQQIPGNPVTPELVKQLAELETIRLVLIILFFLVVVGGMLVAAVFMIVRQLGKQTELSSKNSDRLAVNTDALQQQGRSLTLMVSSNERMIALIEASVAQGKTTGEGIERVQTTLEDSGIRNLKLLLGDPEKNEKGIGLQLVEGLAKVAFTLESLHTSAGERDIRMIDALGAVERQVVHMNTLITKLLSVPDELKSNAVGPAEKPPEDLEPPESPSDPPAESPVPPGVPTT